MNRLLIRTAFVAMAAIALWTHFTEASVPDPITEWSIAAQQAVAASGMAPRRGECSGPPGAVASTTSFAASARLTESELNFTG